MTQEELNTLKKLDDAVNKLMDEEIIRVMGKLDKYSSRKKIDMFKQLKTKFAETLNVKHANIISVKVPQPTSYDFLSYTPILVDEKAFNEEAFPLLEPEAFLNVLKQMVQVTDPNSPEAKRIPRVLVTKIIEHGIERELNADEERQFSDIETCRIKVREIHYGIIGINEFVLVYLYNTYLRLGHVDLLRFMRKMQDIMLRYNAHEPGSCLGIEDTALKSIRAIAGIYAEISAYYAALQANTMATTTLTTMQNNLKKSKPTQKTEGVPKNTQSATESPTSIDPSISEKKSESQICAEEATRSNAIEKRICAISTKQFTMNLALPAPEFFQQVEILMNQFIDAGILEIDKARSIGVGIRYNINTNMWGSIGYAEMNELYLNDVYKQIQPSLPRHFKQSDLIIPRFYLKETITMSAFLGDFGYGNSVYTNTLGPEEEIETRTKIGEVEKSTRQQSESALDSTNDAIKDEMNASVEKATNSTDSKAAQTEMYLDSQVKVGVESKNPIVKVTADVGVQGGYANAQQTNHEEAVNNIAKGFEAHTTEKASKREVTVTNTRKDELERTSETGTVRKLRNPSKTQALNIVFRRMIQSYIVCYHVSRVKLVFSNGAIEKELDISELSGFIAQYFKQDTVGPEAAKKLMAVVQELCKIVDYKGRVINILNNTNDRIILKTYWDMLEEQGIDADDPEDLELQQYAGRIRGVMLHYNFMSMPVNGIAMYLAFSEGRTVSEEIWQEIQYGLDRQKKDLEKTTKQINLMQKQVEEYSQKIKSIALDNEAKAQEIEFIDSITDPNLKLQAMFKLRNNKQQIVDTTFVGDFVDRGSPRRTLRF